MRLAYINLYDVVANNDEVFVFFVCLFFFRTFNRSVPCFQIDTDPGIGFDSYKKLKHHCSLSFPSRFVKGTPDRKFSV